ncbi:imelysin family protein [Salinimonas chungwhensis]|uniref:imelysin family protein n=1 Tax=Salinimonas chungwhensis TaxID=265425 RepID=UPI000374EB14|nr:imelysin family protein [Salinimonas chungwhensis]
MKRMFVLSTVALSLSGLLTGCGESTSSDSGAQYGNSSDPAQPVDNNFNESLLLASLVDNVLLPTYNQFANDATALQTTVNNYCDTLSAPDTSASDALSQAQDSWRGAMTTWQLAEVMQIGPLAENGYALRNKIYSWPNVSACAIDQDVVLAEADDYDLTTRTPSRRGLDALEYTLFNTNLNHQCTVAGTAPEGWNNRTDQDRREARCAYSQRLTADLVTNAQTLVSAFEGEQGYGQVLKNAGLPDSQFAVSLDAVNEISDAVFYITEVTKDAKIATPVGIIANDCGTSPCPQNAESTYADHSLQNIIANLTALRSVYLGGDDENVGFNDFLNDVGDTETATRLLQDIDNAIAFAQSLNGPYSTLLTEQPDQVEQLHSEVKEVTDTVKTDFIQSLALELPATSAGDND